MPVHERLYQDGTGKRFRARLTIADGEKLEAMILELANRALDSKHRKATAMSGFVTMQLEELPPAPQKSEGAPEI